jgi:hypothetical protein
MPSEQDRIGAVGLTCQVGAFAQRGADEVKPLCIDLFCGLGGWTEGFLAEGYDVIGFDIEQHVYGEDRYPGMLAIQDVLTIHGSQFRDAAVIVASPPCQAYSYMAMPWTKAKALAAWRREPEHPERIVELNALFNACFRIQREACEAAGRHIPLVVENVKGAQPWVGRAPWHYGSFYLWGDIPALMPASIRAHKVGNLGWSEYAKTGVKSKGFNTTADQIVHGRKNAGGSWFNIAHNTTSGTGQNPDGRKTTGHVNQRDGYSHTRHLTNQAESDAVKNGGDWFGAGADCSAQRRASSKGAARKAASARIAKIPFALALHIAHVYRPAQEQVA